jgi:hypothetical protein
MNTGIDLDHLADALASRGVAANEHTLARVARAGAASGASPVAVAVLGDRSEPAVARVRAFVLVARHLARTETGDALDGLAPVTPARTATPTAA